MLLSPDQIQIEALSLPPQQRAELADRLLASLSSGDESIESDWLETARRRLDDLQSGRVIPIEGALVMERAQKLIRP